MFPTVPYSFHHTVCDVTGQHIGLMLTVNQVNERTLYQQNEIHLDDPSHPLATLAGAFRHSYQHNDDIITFDGHDFTGTGRMQGESLITYRGLMKRLGFHVQASLFYPEDGPMLGVTTLSTALQPVGTLLSVGQGAEPMPFDGPRWSSALAPRWQGTIETLTPGHPPHTATLTRQAGGLRVEEYTPERKVITWELETWAPDAIVSGTVTGVARLTGHMLSIEGVAGPHTHLELFELLHPATEWVVGVRRWYTDQLLSRLEIVQLRPA